MTSLLKYDAACQAIAEAKTVDEVSDWIDKAAAVREYGRRAKNRTMELDALEIRERARQRRGQLLIEMKAAGQLSTGRKKTVTEASPIQPLTLEDLDITKRESARDQKLAAMGGDSFERLIARCRVYMEEHPERHSFDAIANGPINGARSVMGSRQEPDDSLDYFPTPPWATRALFECVFPHLNIINIYSISDPCCGEGHMAEVFREYVTDDAVFASDIFDYGYGKVGDFLDPLDPLGRAGPDWHVTNPPFGEKTEACVLRALDLACVGVAMFVRLQWLETIGRYERLFRDKPPTLIAFFCERVNLCKGEWKPDGSTATAYIWLVWMKHRAPMPPFWIPPGQRETLTHPDDDARFTAHPVIRKEQFDPQTGEITEDAA